MLANMAANMPMDAEPLLRVAREISQWEEKFENEASTEPSDADYKYLKDLEDCLADHKACSIAAARAQLYQACVIGEALFEDGVGGLERFVDSSELVRFYEWRRQLKRLVYSVDGFLAKLGGLEAPVVPEPLMDPWKFPEKYDVPSGEALNARKT